MFEGEASSSLNGSHLELRLEWRRDFSEGRQENRGAFFNLLAVSMQTEAWVKILVRKYFFRSLLTTSIPSMVTNCHISNSPPSCLKLPSCEQLSSELAMNFI